MLKLQMKSDSAFKLTLILATTFVFIPRELLVDKSLRLCRFILNYDMD